MPLMAPRRPQRRRGDDGEATAVARAATTRDSERAGEGAGGHGRVAGTRAGMHAGTRGGTAVRARALCL